MSARALARLWPLWPLWLAASGCRDGRDDRWLSEAPIDAAAPFPPIAWDAGEPAVRHYLARRAEGCVLFSLSGASQSPPVSVDCPRELNPGERVRLAGSVCLREGASPARRVPMRCPPSLLARVPVPE